MKSYGSFARLAVVLVYLTTLLSFSPSSVAQSSASLPTTATSSILAADLASPQFMRDVPDLQGLISPGDGWTIGGGFLYWANCPLADTGGGYLRRWPLGGGRAVTIVNGKFCTNTATWAADESGLYYGNGSSILRRPASNPFMVETIAASAMPTSPIILNNGTTIWRDYIFWLANNTLYSAHKTSLSQLAAPEPLGANAHSLLFANDSYFYWFANGGLYRGAKACLAFGGGACIKDVVTSENGANVTDVTLSDFSLGTSTFPLWTSGTTIRGIVCRFVSTGQACSPGTTYSSALNNTVGNLTTDGQFLFWMENRADLCGSLGCSFGDNGRLMKWSLTQWPFAADPFKTPQQIACKQCYANYSISGNPGPVAVADGWVYFDTSHGLSRIRADAPPISWDMAFNGWEITQGIQNLNNDVPLVANKPTYVRVYGTKLSGPNAFNIEARLSGTAANGAALGALRAINGPQQFTTTGGTPNRASTNAGWLFQLPDSWTNAGTIKLSVQIDPRAGLSDPNRGNNTVSNQPFTFTHKAPVCAVFVPVRTVAPPSSTNDPNFWQMVNRFKTLWPVSDVWVYHQDNDVAELEIKWGGPFDLIPYPGYGPYELEEGGSFFNGIISDKDKVIISLIERDVFSDDPDKCDDAGARTHYVGMVHPQAPTGTTSGFANYEFAASWVKLPPHDASGTASSFTLPRAGSVMAQELSHNYNGLFDDRWKHVNCGGPDGTNPNYPYDPCKLDNRPASDAATYFGFDPLTHTPIAPTMAADYMSYGSNKWVSDYSWRGMLDEVQNRASSAVNLSAASNVVLVSGIISPTVQQGELNNAWVMPAGSLGPSSFRKWQALAAPKQHSHHEGTAESAHYRLRLLDPANTVLAEQDIVAVGGTHGIISQTLVFVSTFPAPAGQVARMELLDGNIMIGSRQIGSTPPTLSIINPVGGETVDDEMTLSWIASDPDQHDRLLFSVQYSPNNGQTWHSLLTNFPNRSGSDTVTLSLQGLTGIPASSSGGLIRVSASDGYNTTLATSPPFTVVNRAPAPHIDTSDRTLLPAGQTVVIHGSATDVEDGGLSGDSLRWMLNGIDIGSGQVQTIEGLAPGNHTITLTARDSAGKEATATQTLTIAPLAIPKTAAPSFDGDCNDPVYAAAARVPLAPDADGTQAFVSLVRTDGALFACFSGMKRTSGISPGTLAVVRVDSDYGRRGAAGANDRVFYTDEAGVVSTFNGNGTSYVVWNGSADAQISANATTWMAELRIDAGSIGGMNHVIGLNVEQAWVNWNGDRFPWPQRAGLANPSTWATAALGDVAQVTELAPASVAVGAGDTVVTINGSGFVDGATVHLNDLALATTVVSATQLQATIPAANLATAGIVNITVANPGLKATPSNAVPFSITNPVPHITQATLVGNVLTLTGNSFATGATVQFNGTAYPATGSGIQISVTLSEADRGSTADAPITVFNPGPGGGVSNVVTLDGGPVSAVHTVYLPLIAHQ